MYLYLSIENISMFQVLKSGAQYSNVIFIYKVPEGAGRNSMIYFITSLIMHIHTHTKVWTINPNSDILRPLSA